MTLEEKAEIIATGDVPLSVRMRDSELDVASVRRCLALHGSKDFAGMGSEEVLVKLEENKAAARG